MQWQLKASAISTDLNTIYESNDYVCYKLKNELGKIKRLNNHIEDHAFCWFHEGDTASGIHYCQIDMVLTAKDAIGMTNEEIKVFLHQHGFSNDYAINSIVEKH